MKLRPWNSRRHQRGFLNPPPFFSRKFTLDSVDLDGSNYLSRTSNLSGAAASKLGTLSLWFRIDAITDSHYLLQAVTHTSGHLQLELVLNSSAEIELALGSVSFGVIADIVSNSTFSAGATWHHLYAYWDTGNSVAGFIIDGSPDSSVSSMNNQAIDYNNTTRWGVGADIYSGSSSVVWNGCIADLWFAAGVNLGASGVDLFRGQEDKPSRIGAVADPLIYLHIDDGEAAANFATNRAGKGDFTVTGTLATGSTSPSD